MVVATISLAAISTNKFLNMVAPGEGKTVIRGGYRRSYVNDEWTRAADTALLRQLIAPGEQAELTKEVTPKVRNNGREPRELNMRTGLSGCQSELTRTAWGRLPIAADQGSLV